MSVWAKKNATLEEHRAAFLERVKLKPYLVTKARWDGWGKVKGKRFKTEIEAINYARSIKNRIINITYTNHLGELVNVGGWKRNT